MTKNELIYDVLEKEQSLANLLAEHSVDVDNEESYNRIDEQWLLTLFETWSSINKLSEYVDNDWCKCDNPDNLKIKMVEDDGGNLKLYCGECFLKVQCTNPDCREHATPNIYQVHPNCDMDRCKYIQ